MTLSLPLRLIRRGTLPQSGGTPDGPRPRLSSKSSGWWRLGESSGWSLRTDRQTAAPACLGRGTTAGQWRELLASSRPWDPDRGLRLAGCRCRAVGGLRRERLADPVRRL